MEDNNNTSARQILWIIPMFTSTNNDEKYLEHIFIHARLLYKFIKLSMSKLTQVIFYQELIGAEKFDHWQPY